MHQKLNERVVDLDPQETAEWVEALDQVIDEAGPDRAAYLLERLGERARDQRRRAAHSPQHAVRQHHPARRRSAVSRRPRHGAAHQEPDPLERHGHGGAAEQIRRTASAATFPPTPRWPRCWRWDSTISSTRSYGDQPGDLIYFPGPRLARRLCARLSGRPAQRRAPQEFPPRAARAAGAFVLSAPVADAGFLELSHRLAWGWGRSTPSTRRASCGTWRTAACIPPTRAQHLGIPGRRRNGRAGIHGLAHAGLAREARQPDLRHQLQPAAAGRAGARQRQGDSGAGSGLPRRRLERDQGDLGRRLGRPAGARHTPACCSSAWARSWMASSRPMSPRTAPTSASTSSASIRNCSTWFRT